MISSSTYFIRWKTTRPTSTDVPGRHESVPPSVENRSGPMRFSRDARSSWRVMRFDEFSSLVRRSGRRKRLPVGSTTMSRPRVPSALCSPTFRFRYELCSHPDDGSGKRVKSCPVDTTSSFCLPPPSRLRRFESIRRAGGRGKNVTGSNGFQETL